MYDINYRNVFIILYLGYVYLRYTFGEIECLRNSYSVVMPKDRSKARRLLIRMLAAELRSTWQRNVRSSFGTICHRGNLCVQAQSASLQLCCDHDKTILIRIPVSRGIIKMKDTLARICTYFLESRRIRIGTNATKYEECRLHYKISMNIDTLNRTVSKSRSAIQLSCKFHVRYQATAATLSDYESRERCLRVALQISANASASQCSAPFRIPWRDVVRETPSLNIIHCPIYISLPIIANDSSNRR